MGTERISALSKRENYCKSAPSGYFIQDFHCSYVIETKKIFKTIEFSLLANNVFNTKYISNGADYGGGYVVYFPQAGSNFMLGMNLRF